MAPGAALPLSAPRPAPALDLDWKRSPTGTYYRVRDHRTALAPGVGGVFVLWHGGSGPRTVVVGQDRDLADRIARLAGDPRVLPYEFAGGLYASWAFLAAQCRDGVERYLAEALSPLIRHPGPAARPTPVNLP